MHRDVDGLTAAFEAERPRLVRLAGRVLDDDAEAQDIVQQAWLRLRGTDREIANLPGWLTTVTTRLCLDRLRARVPVPQEEELDVGEPAGDPADEVVLADDVGVALHVVLDRLGPAERVAFVLHESFGVDFPTVARLLGTTPGAARKLASRARAKVTRPATQDALADALADAAVVDAFLAAARGGDLARLLDLLAPDAVVTADAAAVALGSPARLVGREEVARFFDGAARAALPALVEGRPGAAWVQRGEPRVAFDMTVLDGVVRRIAFRAEAAVLAGVRLRRGGSRPGEEPGGRDRTAPAGQPGG